MRVHLPATSSSVELIATITITYREFARDLGDLYESKLAPSNPKWLEYLCDERRKALTLHDPYFVLDEPLRNRDSVTRSCLGRTDTVFWDAMEKARLARNGWVHAEIAATLKNALDAIRPLLVISSHLGLEVLNELKLVVERMTEIAAGKEFDEAVDGDRIRDLVLELEAEQAKKQEIQDHAAEAYAKAQAEFEQRTSLEAKAGGLEAENAALRSELEVAMEGWGRAVAMAEENVERQAAEHQAEVSRLKELIPEPLAPVILPDSLKPGDLWPEDLPIGSWDLDLKPAFCDFLVLDSGEMLSEVIADRAHKVHEFAAACLLVVPQGGLVYVNHCGHVVRWAYPGPLDSTFVGEMPESILGAGRRFEC
jgi:hypothetical protein